jgi:putative ABC transport system substrate-binding protein
VDAPLDIRSGVRRREGDHPARYARRRSDRKRARADSSHGRLCRPHTQGREAGRPTRASADQISAGNQPQDCRGAGLGVAADPARPRRRGDRVKRRAFITLLGGAAAWPIAARAQQPGKVARIGFLRYASPHQKQFDGFREGLRANGYVEGQNIVIEQRYADGAFDRLGELAAELVRLNMDVIVVDGSATAKVIKAATSSIPVVFALATDPVGDGLVTSMARPGTNLTGLTLSVGYQLAGKRVELLKDLKPDLSRLAVLLPPNNVTADSYLQDAEKVGRALGLSTRAFAAQSVDDLPRAFAGMIEWQANGLITLNDAFFFSQRERIVALTLENKLAAVHPEAEFVEAGGLLSYGANLSDLFRRAAFYVDKILKGAKPADTPIEQPSKFDLVVNVAAARTLGLTIGREFLLRADEVIE